MFKKICWRRLAAVMLAIVFVFSAAIPSTAFASDFDDVETVIDVTGGNDVSSEPSLPDNRSYSESDDESSSGASSSSSESSDPDTGQSSSEDSSSEEESSVATPTQLPLGASGEMINLSPEALAEFIAFMNNVEKEIANPTRVFVPFASAGDTGTITWSWGEAANVNIGGFYVNNIPAINLTTSRPSEGRPFCAKFGPDPLNGGTYKATAYNNTTILKLLIAHKEGRTGAVGVQLAIWAITNDIKEFNNHSTAKAALAAANGVSTDGYTLLKWNTGGSYQPFFTLEKSVATEWQLKILKYCAVTGNPLKNTEFSVSGPGVNKTGLMTNNRGEILVDIPSPGGKFTVTETTPSPGYLPADPATQTVTINASNKTGTVTFKNEPEGEPPPHDTEDPSIRVETEQETTTDIRIEEAYEYSDAVGQILIAKRDGDARSLDGAIFDILVEFANGETLRESAFEVYNGQRIFTWTHPRDDHDPARVTVREVRSPIGYVGSNEPQTADVHPTYTRITKVTTTTVTITTTTTVVTDIESGEVLSESSATAETVLRPPIGQSYPDFIAGDREIVLTFINTPSPSELIIYKYEDGNHSKALAGAEFHVRYDDRDEGDPWEGTFTTGPDGRCVISLPRAGMLHITETKPADGGYVFGEVTTWTRYVGRGESVLLEVANPRRAQLIVRKKSAQDDTFLEGAIFEVQLIRAMYPPYERNLKYEARSGPGGVATFSELIPGDWKLVEKSPPPNFLPAPPDAHKLITVEDGNKPTVEVVWENEPFKGVRVRKICAVTGEPLKNATFSLWEGTYDNKIKHVGEKQSDSNGYVVFTNLPSNRNYVLFEESPPEDYLLDEKPWREFYLDSSVNEGNLEYIFKNKPKPKILVEKVDEDGRPLSGAQFTVSHEASKLAFTGTTGPDGTYLFEGLSEDWWRISEDFAPPGFIKTVEYEDRLLEAGKVTVVRFVNYKKPRVIIRKIDADSPTKQGLAGAVIRVWRDGEMDKYTDYISTYDGYIVLEDEDEGLLLCQEQVPPAGYERNDTIYRIQVTKGGKHEILIENHKLPTVTINKRNEANLQEGIPDVTFAFESMDGYEKVEGTTDARGNLTVQLRPGTWEYFEKSAPGAWIKNPERKTIVIGPGDNLTEQVTNRHRPSIRILKRDSVTEQPMGGVRFSIAYKNGKPVGQGEYITDEETGEIYLEDIEPGTLVITEMEYDGYIALTPEKEVIVENGVVEVFFFNQPKNPILIYKSDPQGNPIPNTEFLVQKVSGETVGTYKSGPRGIAVVPDQIPGWYLVTETKVGSDEFLLDRTPRRVELKLGEPATVEYINDRKPILEILKLTKGGQYDGQPMSDILIRVERMTGELIGDFRTDQEGRITIQTEPGWVVAYELESQPGFLLDQTRQKRLLKPNSVETIEFRNAPLPCVQIQKRCATSGNPLKSVEYTVKRLNGSLLGVFETNDQGIAYFETDEEYVVVTETRTLEGYKIDATPRTVGPLIPGELHIEKYVNYAFPILEFTKLDDTSKQPLASIKFKLFDRYMRELGTYTTNKAGKIILTGMSEGKYYVQECDVGGQPYVMDKTVHEVDLRWGTTFQLELTNKRLGSFRLKKVSAEDPAKVIPGCTFLLYDEKGNIYGEFTTNDKGYIEITEKLEPQKMTCREIKSADGFVLDDKTVHEFVIRPGETTEIVVKNEPERAKIQIQKVASAYNAITKDKEGAFLKNAVFEVYNNKMELVDTIRTEGSLGVGVSKELPLGIYGLKEKNSPKYFFTDGQMFYAELKLHGETIKFKVKNKPVELEVSGEKRGISETMAGESMVYTISNVGSNSNVPLEDFYVRDQLPTEAVRLDKVWTGVWSERAKLEFQIKTNLKTSYRTVKKDLLSTNNNEIDCSRSALGLADNEYVTEFRIVFTDEVPEKFHSTTDLKVQVKVLETVKNGQKIVNKLDVGGKYENEYVYITDGWTTTIFSKPKGDLPKTGW